MSGVFAGRKPAQIAIVVPDIEAAQKCWGALLGQEPGPVIVTEPGDEVRMSVDGRPSEARTKLAFFDMGGIQLELIEPMGGDSSWQSGLDATGPGLHHIAFWTEDAAADVAALREQGAEVWHRGDMGGAGQYVYLRGGPLVGATIELLENQRTEIG